MPRKTFTPGEKLLSSEVNAFLMDQSVMTFANDASRTTSLPNPTEGMVTYLEDAKELYLFDGSNWNRIGDAKIYIQDTQPSIGVDGDFWFDDTTGTLRIYFDAASNWISVGDGGGGGLEVTFLLMGA